MTIAIINVSLLVPVNENISKSKMSGYFLLEICVEPTANPESVLARSASVVRKSFKGTVGEVRYLFRVNDSTIDFCRNKIKAR